MFDPNSEELDLSFINRIDFSKPDGETKEGKPFFSSRCKVPFSAPQIRDASFAGEIVKSLSKEQRETMEGRAVQRVQIDPGLEIAPNATGDDGSDDEVTAAGGSADMSSVEPRSENFRLEGVASSTSVDFYGTEMSLETLQSMAKQMTNGVPYIPRHMEAAWHSVEWDGVIGKTIFADVLSSDSVSNAFDDKEDQYVLRVVTEIYGDEEKSQSLKKRLDRGQSIGQSIGGWFTEMMFVMDGEGEIERVIITGIELDHLALTRAPANPDSNNISLIRSKAMSAYRSAHVDSASAIKLAKEQENLDLRHIIGVKDNKDGTASVTFQIHEEGEEEGESSRSSAPDVNLDSSNPASLDNEVKTLQDPIEGSRDNRSAPDASPETETQNEEHIMPENEANSGLTLDAIRNLFSSEVQPLIQRVAALEVSGNDSVDKTPPSAEGRSGEPATETNIDYKAKFEEQKARSLALEADMAARASRPRRIGRARVLATGSPSEVRSVIERRLEAARSTGSAPAFAHVVNRNLDALMSNRQIDVSSARLEALLSEGLCAALDDGLIVNPSEKSSWS